VHLAHLSKHTKHVGIKGVVLFTQ
jgi:hypothetical protein